MTPADRLLACEAVCVLGVVALAVGRIPFRYIALLLRAPMAEQPCSGWPPGFVDQLRRAVKRATRWLPWETTCLSRAVTVKLMLNRRGIPSTLYLGIANQDSTIVAHAWVRAANVVVVGEHGPSLYATVASFP